MYEDIWSKRNFPKEWRSATEISILKPGKNPTIAESYRSIFLTSCLCKVLERIVNKRLVYILEERNLLPSEHHPQHLTILENNKAETIKRRQSTVMGSFYISKTYDMCWRYNILKKIKDWKINGRLLHFINEFMKNRTLRVEIGNTLSEEKQIENRVTLFLVALAEITHGIEEPTTHKHERVSIVKLQSHGQNRQMCRRHRLSNLN
jgi:hypothetical protein